MSIISMVETERKFVSRKFNRKLFLDVAVKKESNA
jgi:hypothetical protein